MKLSSIFQLRSEASPQLIELLESTTLGTNGAKYRHLDTRNRILEADDPLFLSIERNNKILGNVTFCRRGKTWYIRYFAFQQMLQSSNRPKETHKANSHLKQQLRFFFDEQFQSEVETMYAYIDPKNDRSKWMSQNFGFHKISTLATQSFSRIYPKKSPRLEKIEDWNEVKPIVMKNYGKHGHFFTTHASKPPFYILKGENGQIMACARVTKVHWEIVRLPGKFGSLLTKAIPFIPFLNRLINPKNHTFLVPEIVCVNQDNPELLDELFSAILFQEKLNLMLWWMDATDPLYISVKNKVQWGLLHKIIGVAPVDVVGRKRIGMKEKDESPIFVTAFDMV
jgi:hypothetical protein